jgi:hypothetical protein
MMVVLWYEIILGFVVHESLVAAAIAVVSANFYPNLPYLYHS